MPSTCSKLPISPLITRHERSSKQNVHSCARKLTPPKKQVRVGARKGGWPNHWKVKNMKFVKNLFEQGYAIKPALRHWPLKRPCLVLSPIPQDSGLKTQDSIFTAPSGQKRPYLYHGVGPAGTASLTRPGPAISPYHYLTETMDF